MPPGGRSQPSGCDNRKKKDKRDEVMKSQIGNMLRYVTRTPIPRTDETARPEAEIGKEDEGLNNMEENADEKSMNENKDKTELNIVVEDDEDHMNENRDKTFQSENQKEDDRVDEIRVFYENVDMTDPANWENIDQKMRDYLVEKGPPPKPRADYRFPRNNVDRCFTYSSYIRRMTNGEKQVRRWMIGGFDSVMKEHIRRAKKGEIQSHFLSHQIQNELIELIANEIKLMILKKIQNAKYFSIILDSTPDVSRKEQMTFLIRCVDVSTSSPKIEEFFLTFLEIKDKRGEGLFKTLQDALIDLKLDINDVRGQGYDNGQNMKGKHRGVQKRLLDINPRAFYTPCGCHSLNLALCDMAKSSKKAVYFFGIVQRIYCLFAASTNNWEVFREIVNGITLKSLSQTRWESRIDSLKPIRFQASKIRDALFYLAEHSDNLGHRSEAASLGESEKHGIGGFEFLFGMVIWYDLLFAVNIVSKSLQLEDMDLVAAIFQLGGLIAFLKDYRETGFEKAKVEATQIAIEMEIEPVFPTKAKRLVKKKRKFGEDVENVDESKTAEESFRIDYFINIMDQAITSLERLKLAKDDELKKSCMMLEASLKHDMHSDIDGEDLFMELKLLRDVLPKEITKPVEVLEFLKRMDGCYPNTWIAYRILLTIPIPKTLASVDALEKFT
ncbi:PREDICTED: zinc finger MYM-type protein 1-like [Camelina sativa]|uniref:Zinc finger MYM-type protein 1-like n=1 Tax=Camelina sativa TaxID=90675 RepID=A0ABM0TSR1_CAMSA|nr:PREDICTED: zinc finger MYM-type protein 1-like [Camelina sativa]